jgi:SOS-response transcriptional repressor LexA
LTGDLIAERTHRYHGETVGTTFAYEVDGDMMQPDFPHGSLAIIETDITPQHGDVILIQDGTVNFLRKLVIDGQDKMIVTLNDRYPAKYLRGDVIGVVSGSFIPRLNRRDRV